MKNKIKFALLLFFAILKIAPGAQAQFVSTTLGAQHHGGVGVAGWQELQDFPSGTNTSCNPGTTTCVTTVVATTAGSAGVLFMGAGNSTGHLLSVTGGGTWTVVPSSLCNLANATAGAIDCAYNPAITTGTTTFTSTFSASTTSYNFGWFVELAPPAGTTTVSFDTAGTAYTASCTTCNAVGLTTTATDAIIQLNDCGPAVSGWNDYSSPYFMDIFASAIDLNSATGSIAAPTYTQSSGYCMFAAIALKSILGTFTPTTPSPNFSLVNFEANWGSGAGCTPTCTALTIPSTTAGNLLFIFASNTAGATISSVSDGTSTWTPCSGANITVTSTNDTNSCAYTLSVAGGKTSITPTMSGSATTGFTVYEVSRSTGSFVLDNQNASQRAASAPYFTGQALSLTGSNDVCFQSIFNTGGAIAPSLYILTHNNAGILTGQSNSGILLNNASGAAPVWATNQNFASAVDGVCMK